MAGVAGPMLLRLLIRHGHQSLLTRPGGLPRPGPVLTSRAPVPPSPVELLRCETFREGAICYVFAPLVSCLPLFGISCPSLVNHRSFSSPVLY